MGKRTSIALEMGPMWSAGPDASLVPDGYSRKQRNMVQRPGRWIKRPPFITDGLSASALTLFLWDDATNRAIRMMAMTQSGPTYTLYSKATSGETWASVATNPQVSGGAYCNYRGKLYATTTISPTGSIATWDGQTWQEFNTVISGTTENVGYKLITAYDLVVFNERIFFVNASATLVNLIASVGLTRPYDLTAWAATAVSVQNITSGAAVTCRATPTVTTGTSKLELAGVQTIAGGGTIERNWTYLAQIRGADPVYRMPVTVAVYLSTAWQATTAYGAGVFRVPTTTNGYRYRVTVAGTSAAGEPVWPTTVGNTVADGTVTWICDGPDTFGSEQADIPNATESQDPTSIACVATIPAFPSDTISVGVRLQFGNSSSTTWSRAPIDVSFRDGRTDGDPAKKNFGHQLTVSPLQVPFYNQESFSGVSNVVPLADLVYSNILDPTHIEPDNYENIPFIPGTPTAARVANRRLFVFKRRGCAIYQGTDDPDIPIIQDGHMDVGCLGPRAADVHDDTLYWIGENEIYRLAPGGSPEPLCGPGMREEIMNKTSSTWVETAGGGTSTPHLKVHQKDREVWVYTQHGKIYVYDIDGKHAGKPGWSYLDIGGASSIKDMAYNPTTGNMYVIDNGGNIRRYVDDGSGQDTDALTSYNITTETVTRSIGLSGPRLDAVLEDIWVHHGALSSQLGQTTTASASFDGGVTFPKTDQVTINTAAKPDPIVLWQMGPSVTPKISHVGSGGETNFHITKLTANVQVKRGEYPQTTPTAGSASL